jgi:hypothetical protein
VEAEDADLGRIQDRRAHQRAEDAAVGDGEGAALQVFERQRAVTGALRDLQTYLKLSSVKDMDKDARDEHEQIWEHVKTLRRRVAALN